MRQRCAARFYLRSRGFTLFQLLGIIFIVVFLAASLFPVFSKTRENRTHGSCASNLKQIGLALIGYTQDYDEKFPPASGICLDKMGKSSRCAWAIGATPPMPDTALKMLVGTYLNNSAVFLCPSVYRENHKAQLDYMLNDLAVETAQSDFSGVAKTVLVAEGEDQPSNVGHAWEPDGDVRPAFISKNGLCLPSLGATVKTAPLRHSGGANFLLSDGHVKWFAANPSAQAPPTEPVFFPLRLSASKSHLDAAKHPIGPDPAGSMTFGGRKYAATFHIK